MAVKVVEIVSDTTSQGQTSGSATSITLVKGTSSPMETVGGVAVLTVAGANIVQNAFVGSGAPSNPYEGQVWIQIP